MCLPDGHDVIVVRLCGIIIIPFVSPPQANPIHRLRDPVAAAVECFGKLAIQPLALLAIALSTTLT